MTFLRQLLFAALPVSIPSCVLAQEVKPIDVYQDPHGIDLTTNHVATQKMPVLSIPGAPELSFRDLSDFMPVLQKFSNLTPGYEQEIYKVTVGGVASDGFAQCGSAYCVSVKGTGSQLFHNLDLDMTSGMGPYHYIQGGSGRSARFDLPTEYWYTDDQESPVTKFLAQEIYNPGGIDVYIAYGEMVINNTTYHRPEKIVSTSGYELHLIYKSDASELNWGFLSRAEIVTATDPSTPLAWLDYLGNAVVDTLGDTYLCVCTPSIFPIPPESKGSRFSYPSSSVNQFETSRMQNSHVRTVASEGVTYTYTSTPDTHWTHGGSYGPDGTWKRTMDQIMITGPQGYEVVVDITNFMGLGGKKDEPRRRIESVTDSEGRITRYEYTATHQLRKIVHPGGGSTEVIHDARGNLISRTTQPKSGSGLLDIVETAKYADVSCGSSYDCFKPIWSRDGQGNQTDFTWSPLHGGLLTQLDPADDAGKRRKVINEWSDTAPINGETCGMMLNGKARCIPRLISSEVCETDLNGVELTCGTSEAIVTTYTYFGATSLPVSEAVTADGRTLLTCRTYDPAGRRLSETSPRADVASCS